jgi:hypothetical protein
MAIESELPTVGQPLGPVATPVIAGSLARAYRRLVFMAGLRPREAANLIGRLEGLPMVPGGWTMLEVEGLLFVRALVSSGRMGS